MEAHKTDSYKQFLTEVFPEELKEIKKRQENLLVVPNEHINKAIEAYEKFQQACKAKKKKYSLRQRITEAKEKIVNTLKMLGKLGVSKPTQPPEKSLEELEKLKEDARELLKKDGCPSTNLGLVGLALSGGGIRSATFNLGVLQVLAEHDVLKQVDYLSTVSGGGYIGSCVSSVLNNPETGPETDKFPFRHEKGKPEPKAFKHLRNYGNYIAPNGIIDWLKMPAFFLRGAIINLLLLLPYVLLAVLLTLFFYGDKLLKIDKDSFYAIPESSLEKLKLEGVPRIVLESLKDKEFTKKEDVSGLVSQLSDGKQIAWHTSTILKHVKRFNFNWDWKTFYRGTPYIGALFLLYCVLFIIIQAFFQKKLSWRTKYGNTFGIGLLVVFACAIIESAPMVLSYYRILNIGDIKTIAAAIISFIPVIFAGKVAEQISKLRGKLTLYLLGALGPFIIFIIYLMICTWILELTPPQPFPYGKIIFTALAVFVFTRAFTDINIVSFHGFYRDQLSKAYLFRTNEEENKVQQNDEQKLSELNSKGKKAPYHLINVALNLQGSDDLNLRDRNADFFILSKNFCGGMKTGFCKTQDMENTDPHVNLGTAMAISGAAAAPNMGAATIKPLVFIMTLLNIRLGYWLPNPKKLWEKEHRLSRFLPYLENCQYRLQYWRYSPISGVGPIYLLRELLGLVSEKDEYVNVSDGGHIENLGIYELLRRRCKYIIACDAEADPDMTFGGLAKLIRYARIDLSIDIDIDLDALRKGESGFSNRHCAFGRIHYGGGETGYLLYIKSSLTGDENEYIREYHSENKDFPHESTGDQFFDEAQFEAYRALGYHITDKLGGWEVFKSNQAQQSDDAWYLASAKKLDAWFKIQQTSLLPPYRLEKEFFELQEQLSKIEKRYHDPDIAEYTYQVYPELQYSQSNADKEKTRTESAGNQEAIFPIATTDAVKERYRKIFHFCNQQMRLMENVFIALQLDKPFYRDHYLNRGWMNLFRRWAEAPFFRWAWAASIGTYSLGFQVFCEDALKLSRMISWRIGKEEELVDYGRDYLEQQKKAGWFLDGKVTINLTNEEKIPQFQIWIADLFVYAAYNKKSMPFPIGYVVVRFIANGQNQADNNTYIVELMFYYIHNYYREMHLLEKMITTLPASLRATYGSELKFRINFENDKDKSRYKDFFERYGYEVNIV